jgi:hypothetical protein
MNILKNRNSLFFTLIVTAVFSLSACGESTQAEPSAAETAVSQESSKLTGLVGKFMSDWSTCVPGMQSATVTCVVGYTVKNPTDAPIELSYVEVYAQVDGKIFKAATDQGSDGVGALTQTWNPGEELKAGTYFSVPEGSTIQALFFADEASINAAEMKLEFNLEGIAS